MCRFIHEHPVTTLYLGIVALTAWSAYLLQVRFR